MNNFKPKPGRTYRIKDHGLVERTTDTFDEAFDFVQNHPLLLTFPVDIFVQDTEKVAHFEAPLTDSTIEE